MTGRVLFAVSVCALMSQAVPGGQAPARSQAPPTFRAETRAIDVDTVVTDIDGRFVRGLTRDDFELFEDGQKQEIAAFTLVDVPIDSPQPREQSRTTTTVDSDVTTNSIEGRIYVMLLDSPGLRLAPRDHVNLEQMFRLTQQAATRFVDEALGPSDLMAVIHVQDWRSDAQGLTTNKALLRASINKLKPDSDFGNTSPPMPYCDAAKLRNSYEMIGTIAERLGAVTGRRKAILWVNGRVPLDPADPEECGLLSGDDVKTGLTGTAAASLVFMQRDAMRAATRNNVAIYPIDAVGLTADPPPIDPAVLNNPRATDDPRYRSRPLKRLAALRGIAEDTGGEAVINTNNFTPAFERIVRANSSYYLLGYRPTVDHRDAKFHAITVRLRRPGLSVRAKKGYMAPGTEPPVQSRLLPGVSADGGAALVNAIPANGLGVRLFLAPFKGTGVNGSVVLGAELRGLSGEADAERRVEISYLAIDSQGATRVAPPKMLAINPGDKGVLTAGTSVQYLDRLALPPGRHEVRVAIHQPGGATGSVVAHVEVPDFTREPLTMSGLVLASAGTTAQATLQGDSVLNDLLGADPTTVRQFARRDSITAGLEVYTDARTSTDEVSVTAKLMTGQGAAVRTEPVTRVAAETGLLTFTVRLPLADLAPGEYVLSVEAKAGRRTVARQVPFTVGGD